MDRATCDSLVPSLPGESDNTAPRAIVGDTHLLHAIPAAPASHCLQVSTNCTQLLPSSLHACSTLPCDYCMQPPVWVPLSTTSIPCLQYSHIACARQPGTVIHAPCSAAAQRRHLQHSCGHAHASLHYSCPHAPFFVGRLPWDDTGQHLLCEWPPPCSPPSQKQTIKVRGQGGSRQTR